MSSGPHGPIFSFYLDILGWDMSSKYAKQQKNLQMGVWGRGEGVCWQG